ncbi:restriction endonuclease [Paenibacillus glycanilyticus]|uniref:restriction endonuclease n=1 Tax=Paenibacillus glycanilyticus TaxID=126569 RepID=UPI0019109BF6|nr:restriction endonuclease [Paenibacillus glycanilyticus]
MKVRCKIHDEMMQDVLDGNKIVPVCVFCVAKYNVQIKYEVEITKEPRSRNKSIINIFNIVSKSLFVAVFTLPFFIVVLGGFFGLYAYLAALIIIWILNGLNSAIGYDPDYFTPYDIHFTIGIIILTLIVMGIFYLRDYKKAKTLKEEKDSFEYKFATEVERLKQKINSQQYRLSRFLVTLKEKYEFENAEIENIDQYSGVEFEDYLAVLFQNDGYRVSRTPASGDDGVDLVIERNNLRVAVQCKRYSGNVSVSAIQEVYAGKDMYDCDEALVVTNSYFTAPAIKMAEKLNVALWNRKELTQHINLIMPPKVTWTTYIKDFYDLKKVNKVEL